MAKTTKDIFGGGYTTHGDDGKTYRTTKDVLGDGYTTHGNDGSTYKTQKNILQEGFTTNKISGPGVSFQGVGGEVGGGIGLFVVAILVLQICANLLSAKTYLFLAGVIVAPRLSGLCERLNISRLWCAGAVFCYAAFGLINSMSSDVSVVLGTQRAGEGAIAMIVLFMILLVGIMLAIFGLGEEAIGFPVCFVMLISIAWRYLDAIHSIPYTEKMTHYAVGIIIIIAVIDQIVLILRR